MREKTREAIKEAGQIEVSRKGKRRSCDFTFKIRMAAGCLSAMTYASMFQVINFACWLLAA
jgi:hypothetical protein